MLEFSDTGVRIPTQDEVREEIRQLFRSVLGPDLRDDAHTPQGQLIDSISAIVNDKNNEIAFIINQFNPDTASGRWQDALGKIYFLNRQGATSTYVDCVCLGVPGSALPKGVFVSGDGGVLLRSLGDATIGEDGSAVVRFECVETGATLIGANTVKTIQQSVTGWATVNNPAPGVTGRPIETQVEFEARRTDSVAINSRGTAPSVRANVGAVENVLDVYVSDNRTDFPVQIGRVSLLPHSIYVCVAGGNDDLIAFKIWERIDVGCNFNGNVEVEILDPDYEEFRPSYTIRFQRPEPVPVKFRIVLQKTTSIPAGYEKLIIGSIIEAFNGARSGIARERIGGTIYASRYYCVVQNISGVVVKNIRIGIDIANEEQVRLEIDQIATLQESDIEVIVDDLR